MTEVRIGCGVFKDLGFSVEENNQLGPQELDKIIDQAGEIIEMCNSRQGSGGECAGKCPIPRIYLAGHEEVKVAIEQARGNNSPFKLLS